MTFESSCQHVQILYFPNTWIAGVVDNVRRPSVMAEEKKELLGFQPHIRTIMEDIEIGVQDKVNVIYSYFFSCLLAVQFIAHI